MILLDTHVMIWWVQGDIDRISQSARQTLNRELASGEVAISSISAWEVAQLVRRNRMTLTLELSEWLNTVAEIKRVRFIPLDNAIAIESESLPGEFHRDPADRMIVATARKLGAPLVTMDDKIRAYPHVRTIW